MQIWTAPSFELLQTGLQSFFVSYTFWCVCVCIFLLVIYLGVEQLVIRVTYIHTAFIPTETAFQIIVPSHQLRIVVAL